MRCMRWGGSIAGTCEVGFAELAEDDGARPIPQLQSGVFTGIRFWSDGRKYADLNPTGSWESSVGR
jgi:hypothetical protein